jgi:hypothetical protein
MFTVHKYVFDPAKGPLHMVSMPQGANIISVQVQDGLPTMWARGDTSRPRDSRTFQLVETGKPMLGVFKSTPGTEKPLGTVQLGGYVLHLFEVWPVEVPE